MDDIETYRARIGIRHGGRSVISHKGTIGGELDGKTVPPSAKDFKKLFILLSLLAIFVIGFIKLKCPTYKGALEMYADEITISITGKTTEEIEDKLNIFARKIAARCSENTMAVNIDKTKTLLVTTQ